MKKTLLLLNLMVLVFGMALLTPVWADMLVVDVDPPGADSNPQWVTPSDPSTERAWLQGLLGPGVTLYYYGKDEDGTWNDGVWNEGNSSNDWTYAVLKYGVGRPSISNQDHWAIVDNNNNNSLDFADIGGLPVRGLSHITYFGTTPPTPVPEPTTMLLLASGLVGLAGFRKKFKK